MLSQGCELSAQFRAIAPHSGLMGKIYMKTCNPANKVPFLSLIGTADTVVPYNGTSDWVTFPTMVNRWLTINGCPAMHEAIVSQPTTTTKCWRFEDCTAKPAIVGVEDTQELAKGQTVPVQWCVVDGLPHIWSGSDLDERRKLDIKATPLVYNFFKASLLKPS